MPLLIGSAGQKFLIWLFYEKCTLVVVDFDLKKILFRQLNEKFFPI